LGVCGNDVERVELFTQTMRLVVGMTSSLLAWVYPGSAPQQVKWTVENPGVIKILEYYEKGDQGVIFEAIRAGETDLTVTAVNGLSASAHIIVEDPVRAESITLNTYEITGSEGDTFQLEAHTLPENNESIVIFTSEHESVATVGREDGLVTITGPGTTRIFAWATPGVGLVQAICTVTGLSAGINDVETDGAADTADVYSIDGTLLLRGASPEQINGLLRGCYILRKADKTVKIVR
ncbi:MAG: competence protein ComJ, partial [Muribaculaceae bacterium]|nr:competence protein ComJ [Muribaculaceae bacterium]